MLLINKINQYTSTACKLGCVVHCSMELALGPLREQACSDVWRTAHQNGSMECMRWPPGRIRMKVSPEEAGTASSGTAESFLKVSHLARTRHAHQVTVIVLHKLQRESRPCVWWRIFWAVEVLHKWKEPHFPFLGHDSQVESPHTHIH